MCHSFFFLPDRPTDPSSREGGRWEAKHFIGMALTRKKNVKPHADQLNTSNWSFIEYVIQEKQIYFYSDFPKETPELKFRLRFFFRSATVCNSLINTHARRFYWWAQWHGVMADGEEFMRWKISTNTVDGYKTDTKCAHSVHGRPTLKDEERFRNGLVRKPCERSLYERTLWVNLSSRNMLYQLSYVMLMERSIN